MRKSTFTIGAAMPFALMLAGCGDDLESRNAAVGMEDDNADDVVITRQTPRAGADDTGSRRTIDGLGEVDQIAGDFADEAGPVDDEDEASEDEAEPTLVDASPDDLRDTAQGFAPEPIDDASGIDPSPVLPGPVSG